MADVEKRSQIKREIAYKVRVKDILDGRYVKEEGWTPNYILTADNRQISRVNIIGVVVSKNIDNFNYSLILDDGSGRISVRGFEKSRGLEEIDIGDVILLIARPREYGNEKYLVSEIVKGVKDRRWVEVRKIELKKEIRIVEGVKQEERGEIKEEIEEEVIADERSIPQKIFSTIKDLDNGSGVEVEEIIKKIKSNDAEVIINNLLKEGEVFEVKPGRIKILD